MLPGSFVDVMGDPLSHLTLHLPNLEGKVAQLTASEGLTTLANRFRTRMTAESELLNRSFQFRTHPHWREIA